MVIHRKSKKDGKTKKCDCGRAILSVRTAKSRSKERVSPNKTSVRAAIRGALSPLSRKADFSDDDTNSNRTAQTGASTSGSGEKMLCIKCKLKTGQLQTNLKEPKNKKKKRPIIERLRVIKASTSSLSDQSRKRKCRSSRRCNRNVGPLPNEVYIEQQTNEVYYTESMGLGFDGISPSSTLTKRVPTRFTFDDVVPSSSSIDFQTSNKLNHRGSRKSTNPEATNKGEAENDEEFKEVSSKYGVQPQRERSVTSSTIDTETDIELSESDFGKATGTDEKFNIFSPSHGDRGYSEKVEEKNTTESETEQPTFGWLFDFSFLAIK